VIDHHDPHEDLLRSELRHAMDARRPDRTAMLNRIAAGRAADHRRIGRAMRLAGSALAVAAVLGIGGVAKWALAEDYDAAPVHAAPLPATTPATTRPAPSAAAPTGKPPSSRPPTSAPSSAPAAETSAPTPSVSPVRGHPGDTQVEKGSLWSNASIADAATSKVTIKAGADLTELALDIRVKQTPGLTANGGVTDVPDGAVGVSVKKEPGALVYHFVLAEGKTLTAGTYVLSARYSSGKRDAADDTYEAYATSVERKRIHIYGNFLPKD
jgi:hypothetical protein